MIKENKELKALNYIKEIFLNQETCNEFMLGFSRTINMNLK